MTPTLNSRIIQQSTETMAHALPRSEVLKPDRRCQKNFLLHLLCQVSLLEVWQAVWQVWRQTAQRVKRYVLFLPRAPDYLCCWAIKRHPVFFHIKVPFWHGSLESRPPMMYCHVEVRGGGWWPTWVPSSSKHCAFFLWKGFLMAGPPTITSIIFDLRCHWTLIHSEISLRLLQY